MKARPYDPKVDRSTRRQDLAMDIAHFNAQENPRRRYVVRRRRSYDPVTMFGPWIIQSFPQAETTTVRFIDEREIELPGTAWRIGDTFRTVKGGSRVITGRDIHDGVLVSAL